MPDPEDLDPLQRKLLDHPTRRDIVALLERCPGLNKSQVARRLDLSWSALTNHFDRLTHANLVVVRDGEREGERVCFYVDDAVLWMDESTRVLYGHASTRRVALRLADDPPATSEAIGQAVDLAPRTVREHLARLRDRELAYKLRLEDEVLHLATARLEAWAIDVGQGYPRPWRQEED